MHAVVRFTMASDLLEQVQQAQNDSAHDTPMSIVMLRQSNRRNGQPSCVLQALYVSLLDMLLVSEPRAEHHQA